MCGCVGACVRACVCVCRRNKQMLSRWGGGLRGSERTREREQERQNGRLTEEKGSDDGIMSMDIIRSCISVGQSTTKGF